MFAERLVGIVGGLHYPVPAGRIRVAGIDVQRRFGSGDGPLAPLDEADIERELDQLAAEKLLLIAVGGHDSSDQVIERIRARLPAAHRYLRVGEPLPFPGGP